MITTRKPSTNHGQRKTLAQNRQDLVGDNGDTTVLNQGRPGETAAVSHMQHLFQPFPKATLQQQDRPTSAEMLQREDSSSFQTSKIGPNKLWQLSANNFKFQKASNPSDQASVGLTNAMNTSKSDSRHTSTQYQMKSPKLNDHFHKDYKLKQIVKLLQPKEPKPVFVKHQLLNSPKSSSRATYQEQLKKFHQGEWRVGDQAGPLYSQWSRRLSGAHTQDEICSIDLKVNHFQGGHRSTFSNHPPQHHVHHQHQQAANLSSQNNRKIIIPNKLEPQVVGDNSGVGSRFHTINHFVVTQDSKDRSGQDDDLDDIEPVNSQSTLVHKSKVATPGAQVTFETSVMTSSVLENESIMNTPKMGGQVKNGTKHAALKQQLAWQRSVGQRHGTQRGNSRNANLNINGTDARQQFQEGSFDLKSPRNAMSQPNFPKSMRNVNKRPEFKHNHPVVAPFQSVNQSINEDLHQVDCKKAPIQRAIKRSPHSPRDKEQRVVVRNTMFSIDTRVSAKIGNTFFFNSKAPPINARFKNQKHVLYPTSGQTHVYEPITVLSP